MKENSLPEAKCEVSGQNDKLELRRELLIEILGRDLFEKVFEFYRQIFNKNHDLYVFMSRKSWCVAQLFLPLLKNEGIDIDMEMEKLTHDRMVHPWFAEQDPDKRSQIKVFVIDDTFQTGRALDECVRRLKCVYNVDEKNITVAVFAMTDDGEQGSNRRRIKENLYTVYKSKAPYRSNIPSFKVNWGGNEDTFCPKKNVSLYSSLFVEALHACSVPYVGYIPAFSLPIEVVQKFLGAERGKEIKLAGEPDIRVHGYLEQDDLRVPLNDPAKMGYYNITSPQMWHHDVEAFYITLSDLDSYKNYMPFFPPKFAISIAALRFYLNHKTGIALIVPYLSLKDCDADAEIVEMFPKDLRPLMSRMSTQEWKDREDNLAAYRLLRYAAGYLWGKYVFKRCFRLNVKKDENIASFGGICSKAFFDWLDSSSVEQDLMRIWPFFAPEKGNVVEKTQSLEMESEKSLEDIIHRDLPENREDFIKIVNKSISAPVVDYYCTVSMMFRNILEKELEMLNENEEKYVLPEQFRGFPIHVFFALLLLKFPKLKTRKDVITTVTLMLCDMGIAVTQLSQRGNVIGTVLYNGEQSCHALAPIAPEYAHFLSEFPRLLQKFNEEQRQKKFEMAKTEIKKYFEDEIKQGMGRRLSLEELMALLEDMRDIVVKDPEQDFIAYSVLPRSSFFDCSELFFLKLQEELIA